MKHNEQSGEVRPRQSIAVWLVLSLLLTAGCTSTQHNEVLPSEEEQLFSRFAWRPLPDTLSVQVDLFNDPVGDTLPAALVLSVLDSAMSSRISFELDSTSTVFRAGGRYSWQDALQLAVIDISQSWYRHRAVLLYDSLQGAFIDLWPTAEFYGGDGSQLRQGSWLFDYDGDGDHDWLWRSTLRYLRLEGDEVEELFGESVELKLWETDKFVPGTVTDSVALISAFPLRWDF